MGLCHWVSFCGDGSTIVDVDPSDVTQTARIAGSQDPSRLLIGLLVTFGLGGVTAFESGGGWTAQVIGRFGAGSAVGLFCVDGFDCIGVLGVAFIGYSTIFIGFSTFFTVGGIFFSTFCFSVLHIGLTILPPFP